MRLAVNHLLSAEDVQFDPLTAQVAAVSCGIYGGQLILDHDYQEDSEASVDGNFVMNDGSGLIELQCAAERETYSRSDFARLLELADKGAQELFAVQKEAMEA